MQVHGDRSGPETEGWVRKRTVRIPGVPAAVKRRVPAQRKFLRKSLGPVIQVNGDSRFPHAAEHGVQPLVPLGVGTAPVHHRPPPQALLLHLRRFRDQPQAGIRRQTVQAAHQERGQAGAHKILLPVKIGVSYPGLPLITVHRQQRQFGIHGGAVRLHLVDILPGRGNGRFMPYLHWQVRHQHQRKNLPVHHGGGGNAGRHPPPLLLRRPQQGRTDQVFILLPGNLVGRGAVQGNQVPFRHAAHPRILPGHAAAQLGFSVVNHGHMGGQQLIGTRGGKPRRQQEQYG